MNRIRLGIFGVVGMALVFAAAAQGAGYDPKSPWPSMRRDYLNTGRADAIRPSQIPDLDREKIWTFKTGRAIFSTPVVGADGTVYVGSADFVFYALNPDGTLKWNVRTQKLIDSAAALSDDGKVYVPGGDGYLYALDRQTGREHWRFFARNPEEDRVQIVNWFEGNVTLSPDGAVLAGNDNFTLYGLDANGSLTFTSRAGAIIWSAIPTDGKGRHFFCSLDWNCYGVDRGGRQLWKTRTWGIISASPALGPQGMVYIAGFDGNFYALDPDTGRKRWSFKTGDHIYASAGIARDGTLYIPSTDGTMYALIDRGNRPELKWTFDTMDAIRSSPVIDGDGNIYFGNSDGQLFVLNPDGTRRWSLNLTESDENDINASMALGDKAVYLAMQDGRVIQVPYDYCLRSGRPTDPRCNVEPGESLPEDGEFILWTTPGGSSRYAGSVESVLPGSVITLRLAARRGGNTLMAGIEKDSLKVEVNPWFPHRVKVSMDHRFIDLVPEQMLKPGEEYEVKVSGRYRAQGMKLLGHIWLTGGKRLGGFQDTVRFKVAEPPDLQFPEGAPLVLSQMSFYQPLIFPSIAQIGMDDMNFIMVPVDELQPGRWNAWAVVAAPDAQGNYHPEPGNRVTFPARIEYSGGLVKIYSRDLEFDHAGDRLGMGYFLASGVLERPGSKTPLSRNTLYAEGKSLSMAGNFYDVPAFGTPLVGTTRISPINLPPASAPGFGVSKLYRKGGKVVAEYRNEAGLTAGANNLCVMLIDNRTREPLILDYAKATVQIADPAGRILRTEVKLPMNYIADKELLAVVFLNAVELARGAI